MDAELDRILATIDPRLCVPCKGGRALCGHHPCPLLRRIQTHMPKLTHVGQDVWGSSPPTMFVGRHGYPQVGIGPMLVPEHRDEAEARNLDAPSTWLDQSIPDIVGFRSSLLRTTHRVRVRQEFGRDAWSRDPIVAASQELAVAARPADAEVRLERGVQFGAVSVGEFSPPHGPQAVVMRARVADNVRIENAVQRAISDTDARAATGTEELYRAGTDVYQIQRLLSAGLLGQAERRVLVPTRWSITATDDQLGQALTRKIVDMPLWPDLEIYQAERFGNRFTVLMMPRSYGFELVEAWLKGNFWSRNAEDIVETDCEDHRGRTRYAASAGGYYAARLAVLEAMANRGRQACAVVLREITDAYTTPLGVWVVREVCKAAMRGKALRFDTMEAALAHMDRRARLPNWRTHAPMLERRRREPSLDMFG